MYNYREMSHYVTQRSFLWRKKIDNYLYRLIPNWWIPLYTMVTFTRIPYSRCYELYCRQNRILKTCRIIGYSIASLYVLKQLAIYVIKPLAIKFIVKKILPKIVAEQVV